MQNHQPERAKCTILLYLHFYQQKYFFFALVFFKLSLLKFSLIPPPVSEVPGLSGSLASPLPLAYLTDTMGDKKEMVRVMTTLFEGTTHDEGMCSNINKASRIALTPSRIAGILLLNERFKSPFSGHETVSILWLSTGLLNEKH